MFEFFKKIFAGLLSFDESLASKCLSIKMNNVNLGIFLLIQSLLSLAKYLVTFFSEAKEGNANWNAFNLITETNELRNRYIAYRANANVKLTAIQFKFKSNLEYQ